MLGHTCRRVNSPAATTPIMHVLTGQCVVQAGPPQAWGIDGRAGAGREEDAGRLDHGEHGTRTGYGARFSNSKELVMAFPNVAPLSQGGGLQAGRRVSPVRGGSVTFEWTVAAR